MDKKIIAILCIFFLLNWPYASMPTSNSSTHQEFAGFAIELIFLSPPFSPIRFFWCHSLKLRARFLAIFRQKKSQVFGHS